MTRLRSFLDTLLQDVRFAARTLRKSPAFTTVAILTLALGIGANTAIFSIVDSVLLRPLPYAKPSRLLQLGGNNVEPSVSPGDFLAWQKQAHSFEDVAAVRNAWHQAILSGAGSPDQVFTAEVSANLFPTLGVHPILGRDFAPGDDQSVVLSGEYWHHHFSSDPRIIGRGINLDGKPFTIVGVMPRDFFVAGSNADIWLPLTLTPAQAADYADASLMVIARLRPRLSRQQATNELQLIESRLSGFHAKGTAQPSAAAFPFALPSVGSLGTAVLALFGAVIFTLLIACANVASMFLARGTARSREMAVRAALGASRARLTRQLLTESMIVAALGGIAGFALALAGLPVIAHLFPGFTASINLPVLAFTFGICLLTGVLVGCMPAWKASRMDVTDALKEGAAGSGISTGRIRAQGALVVFEIGLSLILLVGAGLLVESFHRLMTVHTGFDPDRVLTARVPLVNFRYSGGAQTAAFYDRLLQRIRTIPGIEYSAITNNLPLSNATIMATLDSPEAASVSSARTIAVDLKDVTPDYFRAMGIPLRKGRYFTPADTQGGQQVAIVSQAMARQYWPAGDAIGKSLARKWFIVGIVGDTIQRSLSSEAMPTLYRPYDQQPFISNWATLVVRAKGGPLALVPSLRAAIGQIEPDQPVVQIQTMDELMSDSVSQPRFSASVLSIIAVLALLLSAVGIYGVISYSVSQRTHEIGVRMALGAQQSDVLRLILRRGLLLAAVGVTIGAAGAFGLTRFLASLLFGVTATDPAIFCGVAALLIFVALLACYLPARRATQVDPLTALRFE